MMRVSDGAEHAGRRPVPARPVVLFAVLFCIDRITKHLAGRYLKSGPVSVIPGVFELHYLENTGAAFGMLSRFRWAFVLFAAAVLVLSIMLSLRCERLGKRYMLMELTLVLLGSGAAGNMADRVLYGSVIDFLYVSLIDFPVFNFADICVCCGCGLFILLDLFYYRDSELSLLLKGRPRE